jgi:hypothetical protein
MPAVFSIVHFVITMRLYASQSIRRCLSPVKRQLSSVRSGFVPPEVLMIVPLVKVTLAPSSVTGAVVASTICLENGPP